MEAAWLAIYVCMSVASCSPGGIVGSRMLRLGQPTESWVFGFALRESRTSVGKRLRERSTSKALGWGYQWLAGRKS